MSNKIFYQNLSILENIFGKNIVESKKQRLKEIFDSAEKSWEINIERLSDKKIEYILIAEAAPWSDSGEPRYFYNKIESRYHQKIWRVFFPYTAVPSDNKKTFNMLAGKNFLFIDSLPYSISYKGKRNRNAYFDLVSNSLEWWTEKLKNDKINFADNVKLAFAFKINGRKIIQASGGNLKLKEGKSIKITESLIAADGSGYTNSEKLRIIYKL
jgi:hypothetical protein